MNIEIGKKYILRLREVIKHAYALCTLHSALCTLFTLCIMHYALRTVSAFHTYHTSLTRIDYDKKENLAEISIQLFTHDLVPVLERYAKKDINLEKTIDIDELLYKYLSENFVLKDKQDVTKKLNWVGKEIKVDTVFVYLEIPLNADFEGFNLQNTIFFESFPEQTNLVIARFSDKKADLLYKTGDKFKEIKITPPAEEKK